MQSNQRIAVISEDLAEPWDEGIKKFAYSVAHALADDHTVQMINVDRSGVRGEASTNVPGTRTFFSPILRSTLRGFRPDIVVYVPSPSNTVASFVRSFALRMHAGGAPVAMVALIPRRHGRALRTFLHGSAPDVIFVPSYQSLLHLRRHDLNADILPVGVDTSVFHASGGADEKRALREKYSISQDAYVYLHIGHLSPKRNLGRLRALAAQEGAEVIVIGSTSTEEHGGVRDHLTGGGIRVIREVVLVEEFYRLADCYVFPVNDSEGCVEIPLSVLEALSSGVPVLATSFGGLRDFFPPGDDLRYCDTEDELLAAAAELRGNGSPEIRDMDAFTWDHVAARLLKGLAR